MRVLALLIVACAVSGCSNGGQQNDEPGLQAPPDGEGGAIEPAENGTQPVPIELPTQLYLATDFQVVVDPPATESSDEAFTAVGGTYAGGTWKWPAPATLTIARLEADVWLQIDQPLLLPQGFGFSFSRENGSNSHAVSYWAPPGPVLEAGIHHLTFAADAPGPADDRTAEPGQQIHFHLYTSVAYIATQAFDILYGPDTPSQVRLTYG